MIQVGQKAPDFALLDSDGERVSLGSFAGRKNVVVYFYPKDDTPGCTLEARDFTTIAGQFAEQDTVVLGISRDDCASHAAFRDKYGLTVQLLADTRGEIGEKYGVWQEKVKNGEKRMGVVRSTFIIDKSGILREALYGVNPEGHANEVLERVKALAG